MNTSILFGVLAFCTVLVSNILYIKSILNGSTRPSLAALIVFVMSLSAVFVTSISLEISPIILSTIEVNLTLNFIALILTVYYKLGHLRMTLFEKVSLFLIPAGLGFWLFTGNAWFGFIIPVLVDLVGLLLVILKLYRDPGSEDVYAWSLVGVGYGFSLLGLESIVFKDIIYAGLNFTFCSFIGILSFYQRRLVRQ